MVFSKLYLFFTFFIVICAMDWERKSSSDSAPSNSCSRVFILSLPLFVSVLFLLVKFLYLSARQTVAKRFGLWHFAHFYHKQDSFGGLYVPFLVRNMHMDQFYYRHCFDSIPVVNFYQFYAICFSWSTIFISRICKEMSSIWPASVRNCDRFHPLENTFESIIRFQLFV